MVNGIQMPFQLAMSATGDLIAQRGDDAIGQTKSEQTTLKVGSSAIHSHIATSQTTQYWQFKCTGSNSNGFRH